MKNFIRKCGFILIYLIFIIKLGNANLNIFINQNETMKLLGLNAELYYVRDGQINIYALNFIIPVPYIIKEIGFSWQSLAERPLPYLVNITTSSPDVLPEPKISIPVAGNIPVTIENITIPLICTGIRSEEVEVQIAIEVEVDKITKNTTKLLIKRNKICMESNTIENSISDDPLLLETIAPPPNGLITLIVGGVLAVVLVVILISIAYCVRGTSKRPPNSQPMRTSSFQKLQPHPGSGPPSIISPPLFPNTMTMPKTKHCEPEELHRRIQEITVQRCRVRLSSLILEGTYGRVYRGSYNDNQEVLVKTVGPHANQIQVSLLLQEGMSLYGASHMSILSVLGVSIEDHTAPFLLYPATEHMRNLKLFLQEPIARTLTTIQIVLMSTQLASALGHLHSHSVIHKDIAARNCVIDDQFRVKLTDSSLSRDLFPADYSCLGDSENRPIKWLALEAINKKAFSESSDVWAFGVLMWELCTLARQPYAEIDPFEMEHYLRDGFRLAQPLNCPDELFAIMAYCWALLPMERPTCSQLQVCLQDFYSQINHYV